MAEKILNTRFQLRYDTYANWTSDAGKAVILKKGEVAICAVPSGETAVNGDLIRPQILMKVGDGTSAFAALPWVSALAADVFAWAKETGLNIHKEGTGNVVSGIEWDATLNNGKGGIKFTTTDVATAEDFDELQKEVYGDPANADGKSRIDLIEEDIAANRAAWAEKTVDTNDNTTYAFAIATDEDHKGQLAITATPHTLGVAGTPTTTYVDVLTADELTTALGNYYTKGDIDKLVEGKLHTTAGIEMIAAAEIGRLIDASGDAETLKSIGDLVDYAEKNAGDIAKLVTDVKTANDNASSAVDTANNASGVAAEALEKANEALTGAEGAQAAKTAAEAAQAKAEAAQAKAEEAQEAAETARDEAVAAKGAAETAQSAAEGHAADALASKNAAATSASEAAASAAAALASEGAAAGSASAAAASAQTATEQAAAASGSASTAAGHASTATTKAQEATASAAAALASENAAKTAQEAAETAKAGAEAAKGLAVEAQEAAEKAKSDANAILTQVTDAATGAQATANAANATAGEAKGLATTANTVAGEAKTAAENAVATANTAVQSVTAPAGSGLKAERTGNNIVLGFDDTVIFVFDGGDAFGNPLNA